MNIALVLLVVYGFAVTIYCLYLKSPLNDRGHRLYGVDSTEAFNALTNVFIDVANIKRDTTFKIENSTQAIFDNGRVGLHYLKDSMNPSTAVSFVVSDPIISAQKALVILRKNGFKAEMLSPFDSLNSEKIIIVRTDATNGWDIVFRKHILKLGKKPKDIGIAI